MSSSASVIVQKPQGQAAQLVLLFHGVGGQPANMVPLGQMLAVQFADALIVSVAGPLAADFGVGHQWFSVRGVTEENRPARVAAALPAFEQSVRRWQRESGVAPEATVLIGFSQGAIMALEASRAGRFLAGRIVSIGGRYAQLPQQAPQRTTIHFLHGKGDPVMHYGNAVAAAETLAALGGGMTIDVVPHAGHEISAEMPALLLQRIGIDPFRPAAPSAVAG